LYLTEFFDQLGGPGSADIDIDIDNNGSVSIGDSFDVLNCSPCS